MGIETLLKGEVTKQVVFSHTVAALQGVALTEKSPLTGRIIEGIMHFPDGCNSLVEVAISHIGRSICPIKGYIKLNDATPSFTIREPVMKNDPIKVEIRNGDSANPHMISVILTVLGIE